MAISFISHSSKNKPLARDLFNRLGANNAVLDEITFDAGSKTIDEILNNLDRTDLFVLIISNDALESDWVKLEISESKSRIDLKKIKRILPINIDKNIKHSDSRIPSWIKDNYDLKPISNINIIVNKIKRQVQELVLEQNPKLKERQNIFVGRNHVIEEFENKFINIENIKPTSIIVSGMEGVGRRTFLKKALEKDNVITKHYEPAYIHLDATDTLDDLIIKLDEGYKSIKLDFIKELLDYTYEQKIKHVEGAILEYLNNNEIIFFVDNGCIIPRHGEFVDWFVDLSNSRAFYNRITFCIISKYRPARLEMQRRLSHFSILQYLSPFSDSDKEKLFTKVMNQMQISFDSAKLVQVLSYLNGYPEQIFYTAELIKENGIDNVLKMKNYIIDYYDNRIVNMYKDSIENPLRKEILVMLSQLGTISYDYLQSIFPGEEKLDDALDHLYTVGAYELVGMGKEFIKINYPLADYIIRNKISVSKDVNQKILNKVSDIISEKEDAVTSYSDLLTTLKQGIINGKKIPDDLLLPSLVLKSIEMLYYKQDYDYIISLGNTILENTRNIEEQIVREIKYFLCLAYARKKDNRFLDEVSYFDYPEKDFLLGLYFRIKNQFSKAKEHLSRAVKEMPEKIQARSELVLTLISLNELPQAEILAKENYSKSKNNPFYIQSYYKCLILKQHKGSSDIEMLGELLSKISDNPHPRAQSMKLVMDAQYDFYINRNVIPAIEKLTKAIESSQHVANAINSLIQIYRKQENFAAIESLKSKYPNHVNIAED